MKSKSFLIIPLLLLLLSFSINTFSQSPSAAFTSNITSGCAPIIVSFTDQSTGNPTSWSWDFGNGSFSTLQNPTTTYLNPGTYTVRLTATNANGSNTITRTQYITAASSPTANFTSVTTGECFPLTVNFTSTSTAGTGNALSNFVWHFGDGTTSNDPNPTHVYTNSGNFTVTLQVTNDKGCTNTVTRQNYVTISSGVRAAFTHTQPNVCSAPANIIFTNTSTGTNTLSFIWEFGDGTSSTETNPSHIYTTNGTFTPRLITSNSLGCRDTMQVSPIVIGGTTTSFTHTTQTCVGTALSFTNTSIPQPVSSIWHFGDGTTANTLNANHTYTNPGTYTVKLYNTYSNCVDSSIQNITITSVPTAQFTSNLQEDCKAPFTVNFQNQSSASATSFLWNFGDGTTSTEENPVHTYSNFGNYTVRLTVTTANGCTSQEVKNNFIRIRRPQISFDNLPIGGCVPFEISPSANFSSTEPISNWTWNFGDGTTSTLSNPSHTYITQGNFTISLTVSTNSGCSNSITVTNAVRTGTKPNADFEASPLSACSSEEVQFTDLTTSTPNVTQWLWNFGDGNTSTLQNPRHLFTSIGTQNVSLITENNGCADTVLKANFINILPPVSKFSYIINCSSRNTVRFTNESLGASTINWDFGDGTTSSLLNPSHTYTTYGTYTVTLTTTNGACSSTYSQTFTLIYAPPEFSTDRTEICKGGTVTFTQVNGPDLIAQYLWNFGDGITQITTTPTVQHTYKTPGSYRVATLTTTHNGCTEYLNKPDHIFVGGPTSNFPTSSLTSCINLPTTFTDQSSSDGRNNIVNWRWDFGDGTIQDFSAPPFQHTYISAGNYDVTLIVTDASGCSDTLTRPNYVQINNPIANFEIGNPNSCPGGELQFSNTSTPSGLTYTWNFGDGNTSVLENPTHTYSAVGTYSVSLTVEDANGCANTNTQTDAINIGTPQAAFTPNITRTYCSPVAISFTNESTYATSYLWDFGGAGTDDSENPSFFFSTPGIYAVRLIAISEGGCRDTVIHNIEVLDPNLITISYSEIVGCSPLEVTLTASNTQLINNYVWDFGDGVILSNNQNTTTHIYTQSGTFTPSLILEDPAGCQIPVQGTQVLNVQGANIDIEASTDVICRGGTITFSNNSTSNGNINTYQWDFGDGNTSSVRAPSHTYVTAGTFTVTLITTTDEGCSDTATISPITVLDTPQLTIVGDGEVCVGVPIQYSGTVSNQDPNDIIWTWNFFNQHTATGANPDAIVFPSAGDYQITLMATSSDGCTETIQRTIRVNPLPTATLPETILIGSGATQTITGSYSNDVVSWSWTPSSGLDCTTCEEPIVTASIPETYTVTVTNTFGCINTASVRIITFCDNSNLFIPNTFTPNGDGQNDVFFPRGTGIFSVKSMRVLNRWGEVVFEKQNTTANDASQGWDGKYKGKTANPDVYIYQLEIYCESGQLLVLKGNVALIL